jgi:hypothetical protein
MVGGSDFSLSFPEPLFCGDRVIEALWLRLGQGVSCVVKIFVEATGMVGDMRLSREMLFYGERIAAKAMTKVSICRRVGGRGVDLYKH